MNPVSLGNPKPRMLKLRQQMLAGRIKNSRRARISEESGRHFNEGGVKDNISEIFSDSAKDDAANDVRDVASDAATDVATDVAIGAAIGAATGAAKAIGTAGSISIDDAKDNASAHSQCRDGVCEVAWRPGYQKGTEIGSTIQ